MKDVNGIEVVEVVAEKETEVTKAQPTRAELTAEVARFVGELESKYLLYDFHFVSLSKLMSAVAEC